VEIVGEPSLHTQPTQPPQPLSPAATNKSPRYRAPRAALSGQFGRRWLLTVLDIVMLQNTVIRYPDALRAIATLYGLGGSV